MDCLRSFNFVVSAQGNEPNPEFKRWGGVGSDHFWLYSSTNPSSTFNIEGFKNINIHKISVVGDIITAALPVTSSGIVQDWSFNIQLMGQNSIIGGNVTAAPNGFGMNLIGDNPSFYMAKFAPTIEFASPIQSVKQIIFSGLYAQGIGAEVATNIQLQWLFNFHVYYTFEGE